MKSGLDNARSRIQQACVDIIRASRGGGYGSSPYMPPGGQQQVCSHHKEAETWGGEGFRLRLLLMSVSGFVFRGADCSRVEGRCREIVYCISYRFKLY